MCFRFWADGWGFQLFITNANLLLPLPKTFTGAPRQRIAINIITCVFVQKNTSRPEVVYTEQVAFVCVVIFLRSSCCLSSRASSQTAINNSNKSTHPYGGVYMGMHTRDALHYRNNNIPETRQTTIRHSNLRGCRKNLGFGICLRCACWYTE